ncbi:hypothetical protein GCM10022226_11460 [Sphaerisporangium flaviroseum]|uniref:Protein GrpE n=1 Tax=Sphaerisporangium flaviroseum TaxID=509199 RepID=A0ABP7HHZ5_9ACTN
MTGHHDEPARGAAQNIGPGSPEQGAGRPAGPGAQEADATVTDPALADMDAKITELEDRWLRSAAELENLRKRIARDAERIRTEERARVVREWLPIIDNLDLALRHADADPRAVTEGVRVVRDQAVAQLARLGFSRHDETGGSFDPTFHEAVGTVADPDLPPGAVVEVVRPGYGEGERQLRPAGVIVSTSPE